MDIQNQFCVRFHTTNTWESYFVSNLPIDGYIDMYMLVVCHDAEIGF